VVEAKVRPAGTDEKLKPVAKQVTATAEKQPAARTPAAKTSTSTAQTYVVKGGDTLSKLAERFYNSVSKWEKIYEANRDILKNPNYIYIGQKLAIPADDHAG
jgi:nucleoid-associated protein YgaU